MAVTYGFYNSVNGDRKYNAEQMSQIFDGIINDGVFGSVGTMFGVTPSSGMVISVGAGRAWFNHTWTYNDAPITLTVSTAPTGSLKRIDAVVIEVDTNTRVNTIKMVNGIAAASPSRPTLTRSGGIYQYAIAYITVAASVTTITASMIAGVVGTDTPLVTGPLQTASIESLYNQWRGEFEEWFQHLQDELDENQAAHLQLQIDNLNSGKANASHTHDAGDITSGTLDAARLPTHTHDAGNITSGTLAVARLPTVTVAKGGTGKTSVTANSFLVGNGTSAMVEKTAAQVFSLLGITRLQIGYYNGTGTYGASNPTSITFPVAPQLFWIFTTVNTTNPNTSQGVISDYRPVCVVGHLTTSYVQGAGPTGYTTSGKWFAKKSSDGKTVSWYHSNGADDQYNSANVRYHWIAFG